MFTITDVNISLAKEVESLKHENERYSQEINILKPCSIQYNARRVNEHLKTFFIARCTCKNMFMYVQDLVH